MSGAASAGKSQAASIAYASRERLTKNGVMSPRAKSWRNFQRKFISTPLDGAGVFWRNWEMPRGLRVLMIEDSDFDAELLLAMLERSGYKVRHLRVETAEVLKKALANDCDIVIADYNLPQFDALTALEIVKA